MSDHFPCRCQRPHHLLRPAGTDQRNPKMASPETMRDPVSKPSVSADKPPRQEVKRAPIKVSLQEIRHAKA